MHSYKSIYGPHIQQFVEMKRKLGFKYRTGAAILRLFDRAAEKEVEPMPGITRGFAEEWCKKRPNESDRYRYDRVRLLAQFSLYLCDLHIGSYVPRLPPFPDPTFIPYGSHWEKERQNTCSLHLMEGNVAIKVSSSGSGSVSWIPVSGARGEARFHVSMT